ncbi:MAG: hypothetical protein RBQ66_05260 [Candidatus Cloacimonadaceae bacterium]|nr:hypothetical protein [Candidatus Cloacimonadaceae bacterium]
MGCQGGSGAAFRSELRSLWQPELASPKVGATCSRICNKQEFASPSQSRLGCAVCAAWAAKLLLGRGSEAAFRSELCSLWQTELATPKVGATCSRICNKQELATPSQSRLGCAVCVVAWAAKLLLGRGSEAAFKSELCSL